MIRSGYGISYVHFNRLGGENLLGYNGPQHRQPDHQPDCRRSRSARATTTAAASALTQQGYPPGLVDPANFSTATTRTNYTPADYRTSYVQSWHFTVQRELAKNLVLDVAYVGNRVQRPDDSRRLQPGAARTTRARTVPLAQRRPIQGFDFIQISYGGGFADLPRLADEAREALRRRASTC